MIPASIKLLIYKVKVKLRLEINSFFDKILFKIGVPDRSLSTSNGKRIIYLGEFLPSRISRVSKFVKRNSDYKTVLVALKSGTKEKHNTGVFDETVLFRNQWHLRRILKHLSKDDIIHSFGPPCLYPKITMQEANIPVFYDIQDIQVINYGIDPPLSYMKRDIANEKYCFENTTGVISHSLEPQYIKRIYNMELSHKMCFFPNYCDDDFLVENPHTNLDEIHIVYAGSVHGKHRDKAHFGITQFHEKIVQLAEQKIHFHVYPSPSQPEADYEDYVKLDKSSEYFHYHEPIHHDKLTKELSKYHFGFLPFFQSEYGRLPEKLTYATSLKLFNYVEAGIPVIVTEELAFQRWMLQRYSAAIVMKEPGDVKRIREFVEAFDYQKAQRDIYANRQHILLSKNIHRMINWYSEAHTKVGAF